MIVLKNATFIDWESLEFKQTHLLVHEGNGGKVEMVGSLPDKLKTSTVIDCTNKYVTQSFGCGHHHAYSALAMGMPAPKRNPSSFYEILKYVWWRLDKSLNKEMIKASAYATAMACAKNGVTYVIDHHASPCAVEGALEIIARAFEEVGVGHLLCYEISDRDGQGIAQKGLDETESYLKQHQGLVGLHASFTLTNKTLKKASLLANKYNTGTHIHVAEDIYDQEHCYDIHNKRVVERLYDFGLLAHPTSILVHCLYLTDEERRLISNSGVYVAQNTESNLNNNVGLFNGCALGDNIMFGTDGMHSDMLRAAKASFFMGQNSESVGFEDIYQRFRKVNDYTRQNNLNGNGENNLVVLNYQPATGFNQQNFLGHFVFGLNASHVEHVISNGKLIVNKGALTTIDEIETLRFTREMSHQLWDKMGKV